MTGLTPAERILLGLGIEEPEEIDIEAIAWSMGAIVVAEPLEGCEAMIAGNGKKAVIIVNSASIDIRQRFSVAHEIGHWHYHRGRVLYCSSGDIGNQATSITNPERVADDFASDLILPAYMTHKIFSAMNRVALSEVRLIADRFKTSLTATLISMAKSNRFPIMLVCHGPAGRKWHRAAPMIKQRWWPMEILDHDSFAHDLLFSGAAKQAHPRTIGADAWFNFEGSDKYEVREQSFRTSPNEILTILTIPDAGVD